LEASHKILIMTPAAPVHIVDDGHLSLDTITAEIARTST
jgi:hypothetical protein